MTNKILILYTPTFAKNYKKVDNLVKKRAIIKEKLFRINPFTASLKTHKLTGKLNSYWSFSIDYHWRIVFRFIKKDEVLFVDIGTHQIYE